MIRRYVEPVFDMTTYTEMRQWASDNPGWSINRWPGWTDNGGHVRHMEGNNPACQYAVDFVRYNLLGEPGMKCQCAFCPFQNADITGKSCSFDLEFARDLDDADLGIRAGVATR